MTKTFVKALAISAMLASAASPAMAQNIMGPDQVQVNTGETNIANGDSTFPLSQIADGDYLDDPTLNGFQGTNGSTGDIVFDLDRAYDIDQFFLWNDINVRAEGIKDFTLTFLDSDGNTVGTESRTALPGRTPGAATNLNSFSPIDQVQIFRFDLKPGVTKVKLTVDNLLAQDNTYSSRVEIREVAFNGPAASANTGAFRCYDLMSHRGRLERNTFNMVDQFGATRTMVGTPTALCNPVELNKQNANSETVKEQYKDHLVCYDTLDIAGDRDRRVNVRTVDQLATNNLATGHSDEICVVSTKEHVE